MKRTFVSVCLLALPVLASAQVQLVSGYNFGQFLGAGDAAIDATSFEDEGKIFANWSEGNPPPLDSNGPSAVYSPAYSDGSGTLFWNGTAGSSSQLGLGNIEAFDNILSLSINAFTVTNANMALVGDHSGSNMALDVKGTYSIGFVQDMTEFFDAGGTDLTFAAQATTAPITVSWTFKGAVIATTNVGTTWEAFTVDLPTGFYGSISELTASFSGAGRMDNIQFNGSTGVVAPVGNPYWMGGTGEWTATTTSTNWRDSAGTATAAWTTGQAIFRTVADKTPGTVTIDSTGVTVTGIQFATSGYIIAAAEGGALKTETPVTTLQVDSGITATISASITGTGGIDKTAAGTLTLTGTNDYEGPTKVSAGTLLVNGDNSGAKGAVTVASGGKLGGTGKVGKVTVEKDGTLLGAADSTSAMEMESLTLTDSSVLSVTFGAPSEKEIFKVKGALTLNGTLKVTGTPNFGAGLYRLISFDGALTNNGLVGTAPSGFKTPLIQVTTNQTTPNYVNVIFSADDGQPESWKGGSGTWSAAVESKDWNAGGPWEAGGFAIFDGTPGTVTVSGPVEFGGLQFAVDGYTISSGTLTTNSEATQLRVGDAMMGTISSVIDGEGGVEKTDLGTLILSGNNSYKGGTTVTNGTLQIGAGGTTGNITGDVEVATEGTLSFNRSNAYTFAGIITGEGAVTQDGTGTTTLTGENTYEGGTTITAGTLQIGSGTTIGSITGDVVNDATLAFNRSDELVYEGKISGAGVVKKLGSGTTTFTGDHTYSGGTVITAGTLQLGAGETTGSITGNITNNGTLAINRSDTGTLGNIITGTGAVVKKGSGTLTMTGPNLYTGGTTVSAGVLAVSENGNLGASSGGLTLDGGTLRSTAGFTSARSVTLGEGGGTIDTGSTTLELQGAIGGSGALTKSGTGNLTLSGNNTFTGVTTISEGAIVLSNSSLAATAISANGRLSGVGAIRGNLTNAGTVSPGASAGTITITGDFTQDIAGTTAIELGSTTSYDKLIISGKATLAGTLSVAGINGFVPQPGQTFTIIEAAGGVEGTFGTLLSPWAQSLPMLRFEALYGANAVRLGLTQLPFGGLDATENQIAIGEGVDGAIALGSIPNLQNALNALSTVDRVKAALSELSPHRYDRWFDQAVYSAGATIRTLESRMEQTLRESRGSLWTDVVRRETRFDASTEKSKASGTANGMLVGGDARVLPDLQLGVMFGYTTESLDLDEAGSSTDVKRFTGSVYGRYDLSPLFIEAVAGASIADLESRRSISIPGYARIAESNNDSREAYGSVRAGYTFQAARAKFTPYLGVNYVGWSADSSMETGAEEANLKLHSQSRSSLASRAGFTLAFPFMAEEISFTPRLDLAWRHEFRDAARALTAELGGSAFTVDSGFVPPGGLTGSVGLNETAEEATRDGVIAGLGFDVTFGARLTAYMRLSTEWSTAADRAIEARAGTEYRF